MARTLRRNTHAHNDFVLKRSSGHMCRRACSHGCANTFIYSFNTWTCAPIPSQRIAWSTLAFASTVTLAHRCDWLMVHSSPSTQLAPMVDPRTTQDSPNCTRGKWVREVQQMRRHRSQRYEIKVPGTLCACTSHHHHHRRLYLGMSAQHDAIE